MFSADTQPAVQSRTAEGFKRAYKACEACRRTKGKCELDGDASVCTRCVRERRECVFPLTRSNKRARLADDPPSRRTTQQSRMDMNPTAANDDAGPPPTRAPRVASTSHAPASSAEQGRPGTMPEGTQGTRPGDLHTDVVKTFVTSSTDAMGLLFQAADGNDSDSDTDRDSANVRDGMLPGLSRRLGDDLSDTATSPWMSSEAQLPPQLTKETLAVWNKHRFVVQGWFSAFEAISYLEL